ncbi:Mitogen-activated protein kinase HOG1 (Fragment) [Seminavis robusta]|uniref:Mitogen-activated protein kinase HOG1 n=1 Tax=Seminavis robusta TaxID=568900 RepID=A0A9N8EMK2_9STRA
MGCNNSTNNGGGYEDTVYRRPSVPANISGTGNSAQSKDLESREQRPAEPPAYLLPSHELFHPSANGRNGYEFKKLYQKTEEQLDGGNFGAIFECCHLHGSELDYWKKGALKITKPNALDTFNGPILTYQDIEDRCQEIRTLILLQQKPRSDNILRLQEYFYNKGTQELRVVTELLQQNLRDWIETQQQFTERQGRSVAKIMLSAIKFMHSRGIVHRDIKEANVVFAQTGDLKSLKIVDFGLAKDLQPGETEKAFCGSLGYIAPEIYMREPYRFEVDLFSFGVLMFKILSGRRPWPAGPAEETGRKTVNLEYKIISEQWRNVSFHGQDFIRKLLAYREERLDATAGLGHEWLGETTTSVLRINASMAFRIDDGEEGRLSDAVINPEGASTAQTSREHSRFWVEDQVQDALETFIPTGAFRGRIVPSPEGHAMVEEIMPPNGKLLPYYIINADVYTERECRNVCREIAQRIALFHRGHVVHRKLHMENVVVESQPGADDFNVSLRGVQYAQMIREDQPLTGRVGRALRGWQAFIGPEITSEFYHDHRVDLWSLGAIIYMSLCGSAPVRADLYFRVVVPSAPAQDLVRRLLVKDPSQRLTIEEVLNHPWMTEHDEALAQQPLDLTKIFFEDYMRAGRTSVRSSQSDSTSQLPPVAAPPYQQ